MRTGVIVTRFIFLILASFLGLYGVIFAGMGLVIHLMSIKTFGIPYMLNTIDLDKDNINWMLGLCRNDRFKICSWYGYRYG